MRNLFKFKTTLLLFFVVILVSISIAALYKSNYKKIKPIDDNEEKIIIDKLVVENHFNIDLFHASKPEKGLLIYIDDNNTKSEVIAKQFAGLSYYVARVESQSLLSLTTEKTQCINVAEQLIEIAQQLENNHAVKTEGLPILVGNNQGAALVYTALAQTEKNNFHAGVSINFTPQLAGNITSLCATHNFSNKISNSQIMFSPAKHLPASWYIFQNNNDANNKTNNQFIAHINNAKLTIADNPQISSLDEAMQILQWLDPRLSDQISSDNSDTNLPLVEVPADNAQEPSLAIILTGDGGWAEIDKNIAKFLATKDIPTVALDSLSYFWKTRTPDETAKDVDDIISLYLDKWHKKQVILIGYSFGADVLPFVANRLSDENKAAIALVALLGMGQTAAFEFHLSSWMDADTGAHRLPTLPELKNMQWANSICIYGVDDEESACIQTAAAGVKVISMSGDHHFDEKYDLLVQHIIENVKNIGLSEEKKP